jgi:hypothetical protein
MDTKEGTTIGTLCRMTPKGSVNLSSVAEAVGIGYPTYITKAAWDSWFPDIGQKDFPGRTDWMLRETLKALAVAIHMGVVRHHPEPKEFTFEVTTGCEYFGEEEGEEVPITASLKPGEQGELRLTLRLAAEDELILYAYGRAQALKDRVLVDAGEMAREAGFSYPVALTQRAWAECVAVPERMNGCQDEAGRLWDVLNMLLFAAKGPQGKSPEIRYSLQVRNSQRAATHVLLRAVCGPDDDGSPCITVMLEGED